MNHTVDGWNQRRLTGSEASLNTSTNGATKDMQSTGARSRVNKISQASINLSIMFYLGQAGQLHRPINYKLENVEFSKKQ